MSWYGNGPPPENRFYGTLKNDTDHTYNKMQKALDARLLKLQQAKEESLKKKWPNYAKLLEEIAHMEDDMLHRGIALDNLKEERDILKKLLGIDDGEA